MKIRNGFVSNSSSSSFLIVGVNSYGDERLSQLAVADGVEDGFGGYNNGKTLVFLGGENEYDEKYNPTNYKPDYVGVEAEQALKDGRTVADLKKEFLEKAEALGFTFSEAEVDLHYGEVSSE